jgi:hypothetical protein
MGSDIDRDNHRDLPGLPHIERESRHTVTCDIDVGIAVLLAVAEKYVLRHGIPK